MVPFFRNKLPQLDGSLFLTDAGLETDMVFRRGHPLPEFASHTLLASAEGRAVLGVYLREFLALARDTGTGFILDTPTWKAHRLWAGDLGVSVDELREANLAGVEFVAALRAEVSEQQAPIVLNGLMGPRGDAYRSERLIGQDEAEEYHTEQLSWFASTEVDMVTAMTFGSAAESIGVVRAAQSHAIPIVVSFTVELDGRLPSGESLESAITQVDAATGSGPAYYMVNCAHPSHLAPLHTEPQSWMQRIWGLRCNASKLSHAELDECEELDDGNPDSLASEYAELWRRYPWFSVAGACCGADIRHMRCIASALIGHPTP